MAARKALAWASKSRAIETGVCHLSMAWPILVALPAWVLGVWMQLQQAELWSMGRYVALCIGGLLLGAVAIRWRHRACVSAGLALAIGALFGAGLTGLRASHHGSQALSADLEGVDIVITGRIASLPQRGADSVRFELAVESATHQGRAVRLPPALQLGVYTRGSAAAGPDWRAGDRWRLTARLRRPHGNANPHGFDRERWLWENGIGATGYLRNGPRDAPPVFLGASGWHPVEAARQAVSERIHQRVDDSRSAGVLAALVVGDQSAIDRGDKQ